MSPSVAYRPAKAGPDDGQSPRDRVLLLVQPGGNRDLLMRSLADQHEVVSPEADQSLPSFDLCIVDATSLVRWRPHLHETKLDQEPAFLPVMLIVPPAQLGARIMRYWDTIDEFVVLPIDRQEFVSRVQLMLRTRRLAVTQQAHLAHVVNHDRITGLPNIHLFMDRLANALGDASVLNTTLHIAVVAVDLLPVLETLGQKSADQIALEFSRLLRVQENRVSTVARLSVDQWGLIFRPGTTAEEALTVCREAGELLERPFIASGERAYLSASIGVASYPDDAGNADSLLDAANTARSQSREGEPAFYSPKTRQRTLRYMRTEAGLRDAIAEDQFEVFYQPRLDLGRAVTTSAEALVRWRLPCGEYVQPDQFLPVAERSGLIRTIDRWVLKTACRTVAGWRRDESGPNSVSVNISSLDVYADDFVNFVLETLGEANLPPSALELELTESTLFDMSPENLGKLRTLRDAGIAIAIDDFGKGYSSLSYLHELPISILKIDRAFICDLLESERNEVIARAVIWLARNYGLEVVAEGIEVKGQAARLRELACTYGQGYLFAKPCPLPQFEEAFRNNLFVAPLRVKSAPDNAKG